MGLEDEVAALLRGIAQEGSSRRAQDRAKTEQLSEMVDRARTEAREAARILTDRGVPTIDFWSAARSRGGAFTRPGLVKSGSSLGRGWLLRGATGAMFPWAVTTEGEILPCHPAWLGTLDEGWCQAGGAWEFTLTERDGVCIELPAVELRDGWQRGIHFEFRPFLAESVAYLLSRRSPTSTER